MKRLFVVILLSCLPLSGMAEIAIVTHADSSISRLSENDARQLFRGQVRAIDGERIQILDLPQSDELRQSFYQKLLGRTPEQMRAHWTRMVFTGQGQLPREAANQREMRLMVSGAPGHIGYLPMSEVDGSMKVLYVIQ